ncbi:MAG: DNA primase [Planctomycetaceae bacterium]|nr:DNA primase [Planctomycetaceae bacterium]
MSRPFSDDLTDVKERIRDAIDIVSLVEQYVPLRRSGRIYVGRCPWHDDSKPSLQVNPERQTFRCWVCNIGGDIFSFVMKVENIGFKEALELLADKASIALPKTSRQIYIRSNPNESENNQPHKSEFVEVNRKRLLNAADWLAKIYNQELQNNKNNKESELARKYLGERGIDAANIEKFQLGYAPLESSWLINKVKADPEKLQILEIVGNLINQNKPQNPADLQPENNSHYYPRNSPRYFDRFRGRLIFPIRDIQNRTIAFGGRVIPNSQLDSPAKYINSPETPLFSKHRTLYGLDAAQQKMRETRRAIIMEGYTDCIIAHKFGFNDSVAVLGTALGAEHIGILKRYADKMILVLDGDEAGRKRAEQVMVFFVAQGVDLSILTLPNGNDPCEFLLEQGAQAFDQLLNSEAVDVLEHAFRVYTNGIDLQKDINGSTKALDTIIGLVAQTPTKNAAPDNPIRIRVEKTIQNLSHRFRVSERSIWDRLQQKSQQAKKQNYNLPENNSNNTNNINNANNIVSNVVSGSYWDLPELLPDSLEREMVELWLADSTAFYDFWEVVPMERCRSPVTIEIYNKCNELIDRDKLVTFGNLIVMFDDPRMKDFLDAAAESGERKLLSDQNAQLNIANKNKHNDPQNGNDDELADSGDAVDEAVVNAGILRRIDPQQRSQLIREIIEGFDRRDAERDRIDKVNQLRDSSISEEEKKLKLLQMQENLRRLQKDKKDRYEIGN